MQGDALIDISEGPAFAVRRADGGSDVMLICEHASNTMPRALGTLGLEPAALESHIAWDIGAAGVAEELSDMLDATLITQRFSRLAYDCNRPPETTDAYPVQSENYQVPGNTGLSTRDRARRADALYQPFHRVINELIDHRLGSGRNVVLVTVHSFTPVYFGEPRDGALGILHDEDTRLADAMLEAAYSTGIDGVRRNYPYGPEDGVTHTLKKHGLSRHIANVMLEIRNDLISRPEDQHKWAVRLAELLHSGLEHLRTPGGRLHA